MAREVPLAEARASFGELLDDLLAGGEPIALIADDRPQVVMLSFADYDLLIGALQQLSREWEGGGI